MVLCSMKNMIFWEKVEEVAQYVVHLMIESKICPPVTYGNGYRAESRDKFIHEFLADKHQSNDMFDTVSQEINTIIVSREKTYYTFNDLISISKVEANLDSGLNYKVFVEAEDRQGNIIDKSENILLNL